MIKYIINKKCRKRLLNLKQHSSNIAISKNTLQLFIISNDTSDTQSETPHFL